MKKSLLIFSLVLLVLLGTGCGQKDRVVQDDNNASKGAETKNKSEDVPAKKDTAVTSPVLPNTNEVNEKLKNMNNVTVKTNKGIIKIALNTEKAPLSAENFKRYAASNFYNGTIFHRVMPGFMIQGGGFDEIGNQKTTETPIKNEAYNGLKNKRGTLAMARTQVVDSATSQFFINLVDNTALDFKDDSMSGFGYAVFGEVTEGMDVVDAIAQVATGNNGPHSDWPIENVIIESVSLSE